MIVSVDLTSAVPPYEQLRAQIAAMTASGVLAPGTRLPTIRQLAVDLEIAPGTVNRAYRELESDGMVVSRGRHGTFITAGPTMSTDERHARLQQVARIYVTAARQLGADKSESIRAVRQALT